MRAAQLGHILFARQQLQHHLTLEFRGKLSSGFHLTFPLLDYDTSFSIVSNLRGSLQGFTQGHRFKLG